MQRITIGVVALAVAACSGGNNKASSSGGAGGGGGAATVTGPVSIPKGVPANAGMVGIVQSPWTLSEGLVQSLVPMDPGIAKELRADVKAFLVERVGVDPMSVKSATVFALEGSDGPAVGVVVPGVKGEPRGSAHKEHAGVKLYRVDGDAFVAMTGGSAFFGDELAVTASIDAATDPSKALTAESTLGKLLIADSDGALIAVAVDPAAIPDPKMQGAAGQFGVTGAALHIGAMGVRLRVHASDAGAKQLEEMARGGLAMASSQIESQLAVMKSQEGVEALGGIFSLHHARNGIKQLELSTKGGVLTARVPVEGSNAMVVVALVGMSAAVAIPAFMKYIKKSKTTEARHFVKKIYDGARAHHIESGTFPSSTPLTPTDPTACCEKCAPDAAQWSNDSWVALQFSVDDPHYYAYQFVSDGKTEFTVRAYGDLDCDGEWSTFEMYGTVNGGETAGSPALYRENELE